MVFDLMDAVYPIELLAQTPRLAALRIAAAPGAELLRGQA